MSTQATIAAQQPTPTAVSYLDDTEALRGEIESAMGHIAGNRLPALEESLWRQQVLCTSLKHLSKALSLATIEPPLERRLREAGAALEQLNRSYSLLIQQSSQQNGLLLRLCRSYQESQAPAISTNNNITGAPARSWSCEA